MVLSIYTYFVSKVELIPIFNDNYVFLITNEDLSQVILIDPGEASVPKKILRQRNLSLTAILLTHHHADHIGGLHALKKEFKVPVWAPIKNKHQIPADHYLEDGEILQIGSFNIKIIALPGHTLGHIAFWFSEQHWLFSGDVLFGLGCGRLFEGTFQQGYESLQRIKLFPDETQIYCTHEYTEQNMAFCKSLGLTESRDFTEYRRVVSEKRSTGQPSVPLTISSEKKSNPFLLAKNIAEFTHLRKLRNNF